MSLYVQQTEKRRQKTIAELDGALGVLTKKRATLELKMRDHFGRILDRSGLLDVELNDAELEAVLTEAAGRFRRTTVQTGDPNQSAAAADTAETTDGTRST